MFEMSNLSQYSPPLSFSSLKPEAQLFKGKNNNLKQNKTMFSSNGVQPYLEMAYQEHIYLYI